MVNSEKKNEKVFFLTFVDNISETIFRDSEHTFARVP